VRQQLRRAWQAPRAVLFRPATASGSAEHQGRSPGARLGIVLDAMLVDLCSEQLGVLASPWRSGLSMQAMMAGLPLLGQLGAYARPCAAPLAADSPEGQTLVAFAARLLLFTQSQSFGRFAARSNL